MKVERKEGSAFKNLVDTAKVLKTGTSLRVGFFENSVYPNGQKVAEVATIQEYGAPSKNIPPRPFMRPTQENHGNEWMQALGMGLRASLMGELTVSQVLNDVGALAAFHVTQSIEQVTAPQLKDKTINARKNRYSDKQTTGGLDKPLIDTGYMISQVSYKVETA